MDEIELCYLPGHEALGQFRQVSLSPVALVEAQLGRADAAEPRLNAFTETYPDEALAAARRAEAAYADGSARPLEGLTLAVKDNQDVVGKRTTHACLAFRDNVATGTHPAVQRLLDAGAILIGKTTTPEFCSAGVTYSKLFGVTGTPWNPAFTAGGSSGGSGAALAAGMATLATGGDIGGSIRVPAACCGVVGYKPPYGRIPGSPPFSLDFYCQNGPLARTVGDCALMTNVMAGAHHSDIATLRETVALPLDFAPVAGCRVALSTDLGFATVALEVREAVERAGKLLSGLGAHVEHVALPWGPEVTGAAMTYLDHLFGRAIARSHEAHGDLLCDYNLHYARKASAADAEAYLASLETAAAMYRDIAPLLEKHDALICPTVATHEVSAAAKPWENVTIGGTAVDTDFGWVLTHPFNMLSRLPVLAVPGGIAANRLPVGLQVVARSFDDVRVFRVGRALERVQPWLDCAERRPAL